MQKEWEVKKNKYPAAKELIKKGSYKSNMMHFLFVEQVSKLAQAQTILIKYLSLTNILLKVWNDLSITSIRQVGDISNFQTTKMK